MDHTPPFPQLPAPSSVVGLPADQEVFFRWGHFPPIAQQLENRPDVHRKRFWRLFEEALDMPVEPDGGNNHTLAHALTEKVINAALGGERWAIQMIMDRVDGKPVLGLDISRPNGDMPGASSAVAAFFSKWAEEANTIDAEVEEVSDLELMMRGEYGD